jgi:hypothetical protein
MPLLVMLFLLIPSASPDYLVVVPDALAPAVAPLVAWRTERGHRVRILSSDTIAEASGKALTAEAVKEAVSREYKEGVGTLEYLLLVGDVGEGGIPTFHLEHYRWMKRDAEELASDVPYGDMAGDLLPEVAVGRLPVSSRAQLDRLVRKIIRHESAQKSPAQRLSLVLLGGASGYSPVVDRFIETFSRNMLDAFLPLRYDLHVIYANVKSPYCPPPDRLGEAFAARLNDGPPFSVFMGHGSKETCHGMYWNRKKSVTACGFGLGHLPKIRKDATSGPIFFFSCDNGYFDDEKPCMAEAVLLLPGGPVCTVASSRFSHPLPNLYSSQALLEQLDKHETMGKLMLMIQAEGYRKSNFIANKLLKDAEGSLEDEIDVAKLKRDQVWLYNLLGDPATSISPPRPLEVKAKWSSDRSGIDLELKAPFENSRGYAALYHTRTWEPPDRPLPDPDEAEEAWRSAKETLYREVNHKELFRIPLEDIGNLLQKKLSLEAALAPGKYRLVVYLKSGSEDGAGAMELVLPAQ